MIDGPGLSVRLSFKYPLIPRCLRRELFILPGYVPRVIGEKVTAGDKILSNEL